LDVCARRRKAMGAAVYQLGPFGTAAKKLKAWDVIY